MKILIIGGGGREHTIAWKVAQSPRVEKIYCAPGNAGIEKIAECVPLDVNDVSGLADFALSHNVDITIVGPELPLTIGICDEFKARGLKIFGPSKDAAILESSKVFTKELLQKYNIPTAKSSAFSTSISAIQFVDILTVPIVIKADGLCAGKGVIIAETHDAAKKAISDILDNKVFGEAGNEIIIEEFLRGQEVSIFAISDGETIKVLPSAQDHKRIFDNDKGPNTGGMGAYSPAPFVSEEDIVWITDNILLPTIEGMKSEGKLYTGVLYAGLMITESGPKVLEYNVRFGDPETQVVLPRIANDLIDIIEKTIDGTLSDIEIEYKEESAVCVVMSSGGYPGSYETGKEIHGLEAAGELDAVCVFHAGTKNDNEKVVTSGGRVLGITALGKNLQEAIDKAYKACAAIHFDGMFYRKDIGIKGTFQL